MHANHLTKDDGRSCKWLQISTLHFTNQKSKDFKYSLTMNTNPYKQDGCKYSHDILQIKIENFNNKDLKNNLFV